MSEPQGQSILTEGGLFTPSAESGVIPYDCDPLVTTEKKWYNWESAMFINGGGGTVVSDTYIISDFIPIQPSKKFTYVGSRSTTAYPFMCVLYNEAKRGVDYWGMAGTEVIEGVFRDERYAVANAFYIRVQILKEKYEYASVEQNGVTLFSGAANPPKSL